MLNKSFFWTTISRFPYNGCLAYYKLDETGGTYVKSSTHIYDGEYVNTPTLGAPGIIGTGITVDGTEYANCGVINVGNKLTISAWGKMNDAASNRVLVGRCWTQDSLVTLGGNWYFALNNQWINSTIEYDTTSWHHFVGTYDNTLATLNLKFYVDGIYKVGANYTSALANNAYEWGIGSDVVGGGAWNGSIDEVGIWNRALTANEVTLLYNSGKGLVY